MTADEDDSDDDVSLSDWSDDDEDEGSVEEVDHVKTVSQVAEEENIADHFDPRVLGGWISHLYFSGVHCGEL